MIQLKMLKLFHFTINKPNGKLCTANKKPT